MTLVQRRPAPLAAVLVLVALVAAIALPLGVAAAAADIKISKIADHASPVTAGDQIGFTLKVWNVGDADALNVKLSDALPTDAGVAWSIESQGAGFLGTCAVAAGSLACGAAAGVTVPAGTSPAVTTFTVHIVSSTTAATAGTCPGSGSVDNTGSVTTSNDGTGSASSSECVQGADIAISKTADEPGPVSAGNPIGFTITVHNNGSGNATGVQLSDTLPNDTGLSWAIDSQGAGWAGTCAIAGGALTCGGASGRTVPGNTSQGTSSFTVHITSPTTTASTVSNVATVFTANDGSDQDSAQVEVIDGTGVAPGAPQSVVAAPGDASASVSWSRPASDGGQTITTYTVTSSGGQSASVGGGATTTTLGGLANGTSYTFTVTATNGIGTGPASAPSAAVTPTAGSQGSTASVPSSGGAATTDTGAGPTPADPTTTSVLVPPTAGGGTVTITESPATGSPPAGGYQVLGQQVDIVSTAATTAENPLTIYFRLDASAIRAAFVLAPSDPLPAADAVDITRAEGGGPASVIPPCTSTGGGGAPIAPAPTCIAERAYINGNSALQVRVLTASASSWTTVVQPAAVKVTDKRYEPNAIAIDLGDVVVWTFSGKKGHNVTDVDKLGPSKTPAYASATMTSGRFGHAFGAAGTYTFGSTAKGDPNGFTGTVIVPVVVSPLSGGPSSSFSVRWSTGAIAGYVFDVRYRFTKAGPGPGKASAWTNWRTGTTSAADTFVAGAAKGTYAFEARLRNAATGNSTGWSTDANIVVH